MRRHARKPQQISRTEKVLGLAILVLLAGIAAAIYAIGSRGGPQRAIAAVSGVDADLSRAGAVIPLEWEGAAPGMRLVEDVPDEISAVDWFDDAQGWTTSQIEFFGPDTLYEKINGRADAYLAYAFQELVFISYSDAEDPASAYVDVYVYEMDSPLNAFGIFSAERFPGSPPVDLGRAGYESDGSLFFCHGPYYNQILVSDTSPEVVALAQSIAARLVERQVDEGQPLGIEHYLPSESQVPDSFAYIRRDALSQPFMTEVVTARYEVGGENLLAFARLYDDAEQAARAMGQYEEYLTRYGAQAQFDPPQGAEAAFAGTIGGVTDYVFIRGRVFGGVVQAAQSDAALVLVERLNRQFAALNEEEPD